MKRLILPVLSLFMFLPGNLLHAQGTLEYHGLNSVQRMPDGQQFRFLTGGMGDNELTEFSTYHFPGYSQGDTVAWQYNEAEDQLYIAAWNPKKTGKKHPVKMAIAWRVTSGNPRFGTVKMPANAKFEGFGDDMAFFSLPGKPDYLTLFFFIKYNSGTASVDYTLKKRNYAGNSRPEYDYFSRTDNFNYTGKKVPNPYGPEQTRIRLEREEFVKDSTLSPALHAIKKTFRSQPFDSTWGEQHAKIDEFTDSFIWRNGGRYVRTFTQTFIYIEDKNYPDELLNVTLLSEHKELFGDREFTLKPFFHQNGIKGWRLVTKTLPMLQMKMHLVLPKSAPVFMVDYETEKDIPVSGYFLPESLYPEDSFVTAIAASENPYQTGETFWAEYALDHQIPCTPAELRLAITAVYGRSGLVFDGYDCSEVTTTRDLNGRIRPTYQTLHMVVIYPFSTAPVLEIRKDEGFKWNAPALKEWEGLKGQQYHIFSCNASFPVEVGEYEYRLQANYQGYEKCVLFYSEPEKKGGRK